LAEKGTHALPRRRVRGRVCDVACGLGLGRGRSRGLASPSVVVAAAEEPQEEQLTSGLSDEYARKWEEWRNTSEWAGMEPAVYKIQEGQALKVSSGAFGSILTGFLGTFGHGYSFDIASQKETNKASELKRPEKAIEIYEFQGCPFCRKVRVAVSVLELDVLFKPCPSGGTRWRPQAVEKGGKSQFPFMVDPNTGTEMYESDEIVKYLFENYGPGAENIPLAFAIRNNLLLNGIGLIPRNLLGSANKARPSSGQKPVPKPLSLWGFETSPFVVLVKEVLCELEIPYTQYSCPRGSAKRQELKQRKNRFQVPYIEDPNTGAELFESGAIVDYLTSVYG